MNGALWREREDALRADVARLVQAMRHHLPARDVPPEIEPMIAPVRHLAALLDSGAPAELLQEAALSVVDLYEWPSPDASGGGEGPVIDPAILAAVERLRVACDALDEASVAEDSGAEDSTAGASTAGASTADASTAGPGGAGTGRLADAPVPPPAGQAPA
jgi:hypothetical protein